jgi:ATP-dependent DNA helicase RecQ
MGLIAFFDLETDSDKVLDIGCVRSDGATFHKGSISEFVDFTSDCEFLCGHNVVKHDLEFLQKKTGNPIFGLDRAIDTLLWSPLLFPKHPYHSLGKDEKIQTDERNNPVNDSIKSKNLLEDEIKYFQALPESLKIIYFQLLHSTPGFRPFFKLMEFKPEINADRLADIINEIVRNKICLNSDLPLIIKEHPVALAYTLALIHCQDRNSITPPWVLKNYPAVERLLSILCNQPCITGCGYCEQAFDPLLALKHYFGYPGFRKFNDQPLQEEAVNAAINGKSLLAIFPTGGGKSLTFQIPALMSGRNAKALTVVISPLQSLMKDQVDNLEKKNITEAVTINGLLDPIERGKAIERIENGDASLLYISPESLRSVTIERLLLKRKIARFVIDEAHCFSSWGQDFRVDYLYIGNFISELQKKKQLEFPIPVSCFTATAKQKVIEDIQYYFKDKLQINLEIFKANSSRTNLHYQVFQKDTEDEKYNQLRSIIEGNDKPTIIYVSRTKKAVKLATKLSEDGFDARAFHGKMTKEEKTANQNAFMNNAVNIIVATTAFGMGVDKDNVGSVIHYDISDSLENYIQESGRAGRNEEMDANCYVLFNEDDLDKHFILLNQTKISSKEINQIWKAIKDLTKQRFKVSNSALEIARKAGWDDNVNEIETRVLTAIAALEDANYLERGQNMPRIYANSILSKTAQEAIDKINLSDKFDPAAKNDAIRIIKKLFSSKSKRLSTDEQAESRVDYISDQLSIVKGRVIRAIELMREEKILQDAKDLTAFIKRGENKNRSLTIAETFRKLEEFFLLVIDEEGKEYNIKEINEQASQAGIQECNPSKLKTILNFWAVKHWIKRHFKEGSKHHVQMQLAVSKTAFLARLQKRHFLAKLVTEYLFKRSVDIKPEEGSEEVLVEFSVQELKEKVKAEQGLFDFSVSLDDIEDTLFYLSKIEAIKIEGGFLVVHNKLTIDRIKENNRIQYKDKDYQKLGQFYQQKVQQIHIVGEYAKKMIQNYSEALRFVDDYFNLNYSSFLNRYFPGSRQTEIKRTLTPEKFKRLFGDLSVNQLEIINDRDHQHIVVAAGPGSGKTRVLVHKLASLLLAEDVKHEQLLMLTFSRAAATEFKKRLIELIGNAASFIEIKTFHSYCFDLLGKVGSLQQADDIVKTTVEKIKIGEIEPNRITKTVLVVDEAQDMNADEFALVKALMETNEEMRVILVGDDDQNIFEFRGADSKHMQDLIVTNNVTKYELTENYRSEANIVEFSNQWASTIEGRLKEQPGFAIKKANGVISVTQYSSPNMIVPLCAGICEAGLSGSTCVLTNTNDEAMLITGLLRRQGLNAKLIQTNDGFNLSNLYELRCFSDMVLLADDSSTISEDTWSDSIKQLSSIQKNSNKLDLALRLIQDFDVTNQTRKYKSDWKNFLSESKIEDFIRIESDIIYVSTVHKAKGKEFDSVYVLSKGPAPDKDEARRRLYVAITRAKRNLYLHYNANFLKEIKVENLSYQLNNDSFPEPEQLAFYLTHRDVNLGYYSFVQPRIQNLHSGGRLLVTNGGLSNEQGQQVLQFSHGCNARFQHYFDRGFKIGSARVEFLVYWTNDTGVEAKIVLPELVLHR